MKAQNTLENKAKFFAQYWGQEVVIDPEGDQWYMLEDIHEVSEYRIEDLYLKLTSLSFITDKDAVEVAKRHDYYYNWEDQHDLFKNGYGDAVLAWGSQSLKERIVFRADYLWPEAYDILRSRSYALPWMGLSVEEMIEYGWVKLKEI